ncbi:uncharacterized protein LOC120274648 [Dioscorea cayenensis subsp. rotundata]|uniref:Uncharacterized protein LOC120274648 n=1 Tax=Dioscorea cayennensis subsp. rotundata TaxID=55577 RepID=A0AB40CC11_DIOCR|nr:uncharacterized protein LOC120274648 [Dioscorea cayenensis subsp. rotundata]
MEKAFIVMKCIEEEKLMFGVYMLKGLVNHWYAPKLVDDDQSRAWHFEGGLHEHIHRGLVALHLTSYTEIDLRSGYHQLKINPEDVSKSAFHTCYGHYEFLVMPFRVDKYPDGFYGFDELNLPAFAWIGSWVAFLGHVITKDGISVDPKKIEVIVEWKRPTGLTEIRSFLGLAGYYKRTNNGFDNVLVVVDKLTKFAHFLAIKTEEFAQGFGDQVDFQYSISPINRWAVWRMIQILEDMLRPCMLDFGGSWDRHLSLIEFAYNNSYHVSIQMALNEALYGRRCILHIYWDDVGERRLLGLKIVQLTLENVRLIRDQL